MGENVEGRLGTLIRKSKSLLHRRGQASSDLSAQHSKARLTVCKIGSRPPRVQFPKQIIHNQLMSEHTWPPLCPGAWAFLLLIYLHTTNPLSSDTQDKCYGFVAIALSRTVRSKQHMSTWYPHNIFLFGLVTGVFFFR